jgi:hypothetical protein
MTAMTRSFAGVAAATGLAVALALATAPGVRAEAPADDPATVPQMIDHGSMSMKDHAMPGHDQMSDMMQHHQQMMGRMHGQGMRGGMPTMPGQDAFGAIAEIVQALEADPNTDWSKVDLETLRQHLIDMNDVTLNSVAVAKPIDGGLEIRVTGTGRTLAAIQRMVPMHAKEIDGLNGWSAKAQTVGDGAVLTVTSSSAKEVQHIRGLGFIGIMVSGSHHQPHHLAMAKGENPHKH